MPIIKGDQVNLLSEGNLIHERDFDIAVGRIYSNRVFHVYFFSGSHITMDFVREVYRFIESVGNESYLNLYEFETMVDLDPEVRDWASAPQGNKNTLADALVITSLAHKILANFYMKFNKPVKPTRVFDNREKALKWLMSIQRSN